MYLARKITQAKWKPKDGLHSEEIPADAVTADLRTSDNRLSVWSCASGSDDEVRDVALALAAGIERLDKIELAWISNEELDDARLKCRESDGKTEIESMVKRHVDVCHLDYTRLGNVAIMLAQAIRDGRYRRFTKKDVRKLLEDALGDGRISICDLAEKVREEMRGELESYVDPFEHPYSCDHPASYVHSP